ncbi:MAG TPA: hypothetical protein VG944_23530 [Fimbriimonas sp.]|nr:hypothetical protein [Fimbriimonas sp.]
MISVRNLIVCTGLAAVMAACAGGGNDLPNHFEGSWKGAWNGPETSDGGAVSWTIDSAGVIKGTMARNGNLSGNFAGQVNQDGHVTGTVTYQTSGNFDIDGQIIVHQGTLNGGFTYTWLGKGYTGTWSFTPQGNTTGTTGGTP